MQVLPRLGLLSRVGVVQELVDYPQRPLMRLAHQAEDTPTLQAVQGGVAVLEAVGHARGLGGGRGGRVACGSGRVGGRVRGRGREGVVGGGGGRVFTGHEGAGPLDHGAGGLRGPGETELEGGAGAEDVELVGYGLRERGKNRGSVC